MEILFASIIIAREISTWLTVSYITTAAASTAEQRTRLPKQNLRQRPLRINEFPRRRDNAIRITPMWQGRVRREKMKIEAYRRNDVLEGYDEHFQDTGVPRLQLGTSRVSAWACTRSATTTKLQGGDIKPLRRESQLAQE